MNRKQDIPLPEINHPVDLIGDAPRAAGPLGKVATDTGIGHSGRLPLGEGYEGPVDSPDTPKAPLTPEEVDKHTASLPTDVKGIPGDYANHTRQAYLGLTPAGAQPKPKKESLWNRIPKAAKVGSLVLAGMVVVGTALGVTGVFGEKKEETTGPTPGNAPATAGTLGVGEQGNGAIDTEVGVTTVQATTTEAPATAQATTPAQTSAAETSAASTTGFRDGKGAGDPNGTQPAIPATPTAGAETTTSATEAIVNPDGTVVIPESLANNPEALGAALVTSFENWEKAGATVDEVKMAYESDPAKSKYANDPNAIYNYPNDVAADNQALFAGNIFADGWGQKPDLVQEAKTWTRNNALYLGRVNATANKYNMDGLTFQGDIYQQLALYDEDYTLLGSSKIPSSQDGTVVMRIQFHVKGNAPDTNIPQMSPSPGNTEFTADKTVTLVTQKNGSGQNVLKIAGIVNN